MNLNLMGHLQWDIYTENFHGTFTMRMKQLTLPPRIMEVKNWCISNSSYLSNIKVFSSIFQLHDYGRKSRVTP